MRLSLVTLLALASTGSYASSFPSIEATSTTEDPLLPREPQDIPTDPILITSSVRGTHIKTSIAHSNPPVASSVVPPGVSSVVVPSHSIITSVQDPAKPSSVVLSSQSSYQMTSSHVEPSAPAPAPPSSATSSPWLSSVHAPAPPSSVVWSDQPSSQVASSQWVPAPSSSATWNNQPSSQGGSSVVVPSQTASSGPANSATPSSGISTPPPSGIVIPTPSGTPVKPSSGTNAAPSSGTFAAPPPASSASGSSTPATSPLAGSSAWSSAASGSVPSSAVSASSVTGSSAILSSRVSSSPGASASPSSVWSNPTGSTTATGSSVPPASSVSVPKSSAQPSGSFSTVTSNSPSSSAAQPSSSAISSDNPTSVQSSSTPGGIIVIPPGILTSSTSGATPIIPSSISGSSTPSGIHLPSESRRRSSSTPGSINPPSSAGKPSGSTPGGTSPFPIVTPSSSRPGGTGPVPTGTQSSNPPGSIGPFPIGTPSSSTPGSIGPSSSRTPTGTTSGGIFSKPTGTLSNIPPSPTTTGCPKECSPFDWCKIYCEGWPFPRPIDEQPPNECLLPENRAWCHPWWFGPVDIDGSDGDPDSHSDSDPGCKENNCIADCISWRLMTFLLFKRPVCPCIPTKCDKDGDSDSPSDSDRDDDKGPKPKPTSYPKPNKPECKLLGCGCGWMGLNYGPGCPGVDFELNIPCGLFGCSPCTFFGSCPGDKQPVNAILGYGGYCRGEGCSSCPPELCSRPGCTIPGGCGPKPGPAPTKPADAPDPDRCEDKQRTVITERVVFCTEGFDISAMPSTSRGTGSTSSTMISSICVPLIDATQTICGPAFGFDTTTTKTGTNTLTSDAPACTRAPLSLDDDEGNNNPDDSLFETSSIFASNTTMFASSTSKGTSSMTPRSSSTAPAPSHTPMDRNGHWKVNIGQWMWDDYSEVGWTLYDPNGFEAGKHTTRGNGLKEMKEYIQSVNRPFGDSMPFGVDMTVSQPHDHDHSRITFKIKKEVKGCGECSPHMTTEDYTESRPFEINACEKSCSKQGKSSPLKALSDLWCDDLNTADWETLANGWKRSFNCGWKGFD